MLTDLKVTPHPPTHHHTLCAMFVECDDASPAPLPKGEGRFWLRVGNRVSIDLEIISFKRACRNGKERRARARCLGKQNARGVCPALSYGKANTSRVQRAPTYSSNKYGTSTTATLGCVSNAARKRCAVRPCSARSHQCAGINSGSTMVTNASGIWSCRAWTYEIIGRTNCRYGESRTTKGISGAYFAMRALTRSACSGSVPTCKAITCAPIERANASARSEA